MSMPPRRVAGAQIPINDTITPRKDGQVDGRGMEIAVAGVLRHFFSERGVAAAQRLGSRLGKDQEKTARSRYI